MFHGFVLGPNSQGTALGVSQGDKAQLGCIGSK